MPPSPPTCVSCAEPLRGPYCHACGEKALGPKDLGLGQFLHDAFHFNTHLDNKLVKTLGPLVARPGALTQAWIEGRRAAYAKPIQLFVVLNLVFFLIAAKVGILNWNVRWFMAKGRLPGITAEMLEAKRVALGLTPDAFYRAFDHGLDPHKKWVFLFLIPITALVVWLLHPRRRLVEHLVFAIHYATFLFLFFLGIWGLLFAVSFAINLRGIDDSVVIPISHVVMSAYLAVALRRVYGTGWPRAVGEAVVVALAFIPSILLAQRVAFALALKGLG